MTQPSTTTPMLTSILSSTVLGSICLPRLDLNSSSSEEVEVGPSPHGNPRESFSISESSMIILSISGTKSKPDLKRLEIRCSLRTSSDNKRLMEMRLKLLSKERRKWIMQQIIPVQHLIFQILRQLLLEDIRLLIIKKMRKMLELLIELRQLLIMRAMRWL